MVGEQAGADARTGCKDPAVDSDGLLQRCHQFRGFCFDLLDRSDVFDQHGEFVATQASEHAVEARCRPQPFRDSLQHAVAEVVAQRVVDRLEVVDIEEQQR